MATTTINNSVLLKTSSASDVKCSGGDLSITGIADLISKKNISSISQIKYRAEVAQVVTVGGTSYTPANSTTYTVVIYDPLRSQSSVQEAPRQYSFTTVADVTTYGNAAAQREAIHVGLVALINADSNNNHVTAATLGGGTGFTVTDDGGYWPVRSQNMTNVKGISTVYTIYNASGTGFGDSNFSITTAGVYSSGVGAKLASEAPVIDFVYGNLISGVLVAPPLAPDGTAAVSGQNYDTFVISSLKEVSAHNVTGQVAYQERFTRVYVDNGTGSSTSNLAGFKAFERAMLNHIFELYSNDPSTIYYMGDTAAVSQGLATGLPSGVAQAENVIAFGNGFAAHYSPIATSTLLALVSTNSGLGLILDATASEGVELSAPTWTNSQKQFVVGQQEFSIYTKVTIDDVSGLNPFWVGFRKKEAYAATFANYTDYAVIGLGNATGDIYTSTENDGGGATSTDTTQNWADTETHTLEVKVDIDGAVTFAIDGYAPTVTQAFTFDAGDALIPVFGYALQTADIGTPSVLELAAIPSATWRS